jgi:hypothetical protein
MEKALTKRRNQPVEASVPDLTPLTLLHQAIEQNVDLEKLQRLMDMQEQWEKKQAKKAFFKALSGFQAMCPAIKKNKTANIRSEKGNYSYKYAELGNVEAQIKGAMEKCELTKRWEISEEGPLLKVTCLITHIDGHTEVTEMKAEKDASGGKNNIQQKASTITYLKRYTLLGGLGISTADEDNDGRGNPSTNQAPPALTEEEILDQWKQSVDGVSTRIALKALYLGNKKAVDGNAKVQAIFKAREEQLPVIPKTDLP